VKYPLVGLWKHLVYRNTASAALKLERHWLV